MPLSLQSGFVIYTNSLVCGVDRFPVNSFAALCFPNGWQCIVPFDIDGGKGKDIDDMKDQLKANEVTLIQILVGKVIEGKLQLSTFKKEVWVEINNEMCDAVGVGYGIDILKVVTRPQRPRVSRGLDLSGMLSESVVYRSWIFGFDSGIPRVTISGRFCDWTRSKGLHLLISESGYAIIGTVRGGQAPVHLDEVEIEYGNEETLPPLPPVGGEANEREEGTETFKEGFDTEGPETLGENSSSD
ncbi:hypothetical protein GQ457_18G011440 [Hibiscus cannabinus]